MSPAVHNEQPAVHCHETEIRKLLCVTAFCSCFGCCTISKQELKHIIKRIMFDLQSSAVIYMTFTEISIIQVKNGKKVVSMNSLAF